MRKSKCLLWSVLMTFLFVMVNAIHGQNLITDYAPHTKVGQEPPLWLKNKVTPVQYDSLVAFSKFFAVNYNYFKQRNLTQKDIQVFVNRTGQLLKDKELLQQIRQKGGEACKYSMDLRPETLHPFAVSADKDGAGRKYIIYSEIDGYDAHAMLTAKASADGSTSLSHLNIVPYSLSGLKVVLSNMHIHEAGSKSAESAQQIGFDDKGRSKVYEVSGLLKVEDAMGNVHTQLIDKTIRLMAE